MATNEASVISAVCRGKDIHVILGEDATIFGDLADVFEFMKDYYLKHKAVPEQALIEHRFELESGYLPDTSAPSAYYMEQLRAAFVRNRMESIMMSAGSALERDAAPAVLEKLTTSLAKLGKYTNSVRDLNMTDADSATEYFKKLRGLSELNGGSPGISTGFKSIDSTYSTGLAPGQSICLMGFTGKAKSMFSALLAVKAWEQGKKVMIVSLEMSPEEYRDRVYAMMSSGLFKIDDMSRGDVNEDDFRTWSRKAFEESPDFIVTSSQGVSEVTPNIIQARIDTHRPDLVVLDYDQLFMDNAKTQGMTPRMLNFSREVKLLAVSNAIPIIHITAVTDEDHDKRDAPPLLSQVAWSKGIEYDANLIIAVHRRDDSNIVEIVCRKSRHGDLFSFYFDVQFNEGIWVEKFTLD